jgi:hypothetical protein
MEKWTVNFYRDGSLLTTGHGTAEDELRAATLAEFTLLAMYPNVTFDKVEVLEER